MLIQLNPPIPVTTPKGPAIAHFVIDYGPESDLKWICFQQTTGECWTYSNTMIRAQKNITENREYISPFYNPDEAALRKGGGWFCGACGGHNKCECEDDSISGTCDECGEYNYDCTCEDCNYEEAYKQKCEQLSEAKEDIYDLKKTNEKIEVKFKSLQETIKKLIKNDHVFPNVRAEVQEVIDNVEDKDDIEEIPY